MTTPFDIIVPAAGVGARMAADLVAPIPKQYLPLAGVPILERTLAKLLELKPRKLCLVVGENDEYWQALPSASRCEIVIGGASRADSVAAGVNALQAANNEPRSLVVVHDAVRPLIALEDVRELMRVAEQCEDGAILAVPVIDTLKSSDEESRITSTPDRRHFWQAQTPQVFFCDLLDEALATARRIESQVTDEASAVELLGRKPKLVSGSRNNIKITTVEDLALAEFLLQRKVNSCE